MRSLHEFSNSAAADQAATWSIADVERDTGLGKDTLRVWERRYGFPMPQRSGLGERMYPADQVHRLKLIKRLLDVGHRPGKVVPLTVMQLQALLAQPGSVARRAPAEQVASRLAEWPADPELPWLTWLKEDRHDRIRQGLQQQIGRHGLGTAVEQLVAPLCALVGDAWWRGDLSIYQEHLFTQTVQTVLREAIASLEAVGQPDRGPRVLLTTMAGEQHGLGLLMAECFFALESCERFVLGVSTPVADIAQAVEQLRIDVLALSFSAHASRRDLGDGLQQLLGQLPLTVEVWAGGAGTALHGRFAPQGIVQITRAGDLPRHIQRWRRAQGADSGIMRA